MVESAREVCGSVKMGRKNPNSVSWNVEIKAADRRKDTVMKRQKKMYGSVQRREEKG